MSCLIDHAMTPLNIRLEAEYIIVQVRVSDGSVHIYSRLTKPPFFRFFEVFHSVRVGESGVLIRGNSGHEHTERWFGQLGKI